MRQAPRDRLKARESSNGATQAADTSPATTNGPHRSRPRPGRIGLVIGTLLVACIWTLGLLLCVRESDTQRRTRQGRQGSEVRGQDYEAEFRSVTPSRVPHGTAMRGSAGDTPSPDGFGLPESAGSPHLAHLVRVAHESGPHSSHSSAAAARPQKVIFWKIKKTGSSSMASLLTLQVLDPPNHAHWPADLLPALFCRPVSLSPSLCVWFLPLHSFSHSACPLSWPSREAASPPAKRWSMHVE